ncbi:MULTISPECIES: hypothetical protein [unclassified Thioalkalivibrio]|uniref:hypothetical protein n=1 Tax=unclassified Thioalkalivibrio TaxID=2621013 RepID=UPI001E444755|nr:MULTISPECIES: hypothetical protein [unclassified Thioalkalivibrio]
MSLQKGFWSPEANARDRKAYADTTTQEETVLRVEVSVMKDVVDDIYRQLQATMAEIQKHDLPSLEAVHVEVQEAEAKHFNLMMGTPVPVVPLLGRIRPRNEGVGGAG